MLLWSLTIENIVYLLLIDDFWTRMLSNYIWS